MRSRLAPLFVLLAACHPSVGTPAAAPAPANTPPQEADKPQRPYPATYEVVPDAELAQKTSALSAKTPGWTIMLDPFGMLATATCDACTRTDPAILDVTGDDRKRAEAFLLGQQGLVHLDAPAVMTKFDRPSGMLYEQSTSSGVAATVMVQRAQGVVSVSGHMWPDLPTPGAWIADRELAAKLGAVTANPSIEHRYVRIARSEHGPLEVREGVCLPSESSRATSPPCLDARTGEDISNLKIGWTLHQGRNQPATRILVRQ